MDLVYGNRTEEVEGPWNDIENALPISENKGEKVKVKLKNGDELFAYFYEDKCQWIQNSGGTPCYFWDCQTKEPLFYVEKWKYLKEKNDALG